MRDHTMVLWCRNCEADKTHVFVEGERGDRWQPGWEPCYACCTCDEEIEMWELDDGC